ncbi:MAG: DivIVA domain-containing protein [Ruminococcus sp.]|nr:DivIVA domain-containing protein [Ruminococcus sp.]
MITANDIHELRFEKAAFGYKQEDIDEFLTQLEHELELNQQEIEDSNNKIQVLADKVREYMRDEDALKDALLGAQRQGHQIIAEANERADEIIAEAKRKADEMMDEVTIQHDALLKKNQEEVAAAHEQLADARKKVADFKKALFDMYKEHLEVLSAMPEEDDLDFSVDYSIASSEITKDTSDETITASPSKSDPFATSQFSAKTIQGAYERSFIDEEE